MGKKLVKLVIAATLLFLSITAHAKPLDPSLIYTNTIGEYASIVHENKKTLSLEEVVSLYRSGLAPASKESYLNFGIGSKPVWLIFEIQNNTVSSIEKRVSIETSWLDVVDIHVLRDDQPINSYYTGDSLPFSSRPIDSRFFSFDHHYQIGETLVVLRVATPDPLAMPIYFRSIDASIARDQSLGYVYGFLYGVIVALLVYNLILSASLKNSSYLFYSLYMMTFIATNIAYTGHGYQWFWSGSPEWQMWSVPILMTSYATMGFLFATRFLDTKNSLPRFHRVIMTGCLLVITALIVSVLLGKILTVLLLAFSVVFLFAFGMAYVGILASLNRNRSAYYFLIAALLGAGGATITCATVWGVLPYNAFSYASVEFGMMFEAVILALALASRFNLINKEKDIAENLARLDPLTGLFNRRAFNEYSLPIWHAGLRSGRDMAIIVMDIDRFKWINDIHGHAAGDNVLMAISEVLKEEARGGDITARWGGEEFIIFLPETTLTMAVEVAERYRRRIENIKLPVEHHVVSFTASFGVATKSQDEVSFEALISEADKKLYEAKDHGRNSVAPAWSN